MKTILVVEDELSIRTFISLNLRKKNYQVFEAITGEEAIELFHTNKIDLVLLDLMLPGMDGFLVCQELRKSSLSVGIIMLTARTQEEDKIKGLIQGADDYLSKPFSMVELEARMISLFRRIGNKSEKSELSSIKSGPFLLDINNNRITCAGREVKLTPTEFYILTLLISNKNQVFTRNELLDKVWGVNYIGDIKVVDVNIRRIRTKVEPDPSNPSYLLTAWGHGYMWKE